MPFGLASAASVFQTLMKETLEGLNGAVAFQDYILVFVKHEKEHDCNLEKVLAALVAKGLTLHSDKYRFRKREVEHLGHCISGAGIKPKTKHVENISKVPIPNCKEQLVAILGLIKFYAKLIPNYASRVDTYRCLLKKNAKFERTENLSVAFAAVKDLIVNALCLKPFVVGKHCNVMVDASNCGLGGILIQEEHGRNGLWQMLQERCVN